jgi:hypothetical protein
MGAMRNHGTALVLVFFCLILPCRVMGAGTTYDDREGRYSITIPERFTVTYDEARRTTTLALPGSTCVIAIFYDIPKNMPASKGIYTMEFADMNHVMSNYPDYQKAYEAPFINEGYAIERKGTTTAGKIPAFYLLFSRKEKDGFVLKGRKVFIVAGERIYYLVLTAREKDFEEAHASFQSILSSLYVNTEKYQPAVAREVIYTDSDSVFSFTYPDYFRCQVDAKAHLASLTCSEKGLGMNFSYVLAKESPGSNIHKLVKQYPFVERQAIQSVEKGGYSVGPRKLITIKGIPALSYEISMTPRDRMPAKGEYSAMLLDKKMFYFSFSGLDRDFNENAALFRNIIDSMKFPSSP